MLILVQVILLYSSFRMLTSCLHEDDDGTELDNTLAARDVITALTALYDNVALSPMYTKQVRSNENE